MTKPKNSIPKISIKNVTKQFDTEPKARGLAIKKVSFDVAPKEFVTIVGRSGCGKTTLLNMIAGLLSPTSGEILIDGKLINGAGPDRGMVFQQASLFPWLTAIKNIEFGPKNQGISKEERLKQAQELIKLVRLEGAENKYPRELSGGMRQRVAIARALALDPDIMLMDEPFGALDELTRSEMQSELLRIWEARRKTVVFVTHSIFEAIFLSDRIIVISPHPGQVSKQIKIDIPRPRSRSSKPFLEIYEDIHEAIF